MNTKTIIRIEHPSDGKGLWCSVIDGGTIYDKRINNHSKFNDIADRHATDAFPNFWEDRVLSKAIDHEELHKYNFAFKSLDQLKTALTSDEMKECINILGFRILMLDVTDYHESDYQIIFKKKSIVSYKDISFMFL